ncbi:MAG: hypothetical protein JO367_19100, partial [Actinobacteria bacterium]|nr:hypothetical protein [Actinomycetota bacterium]
MEVVELEGAPAPRGDRWARRAVLFATIALFAASVAGLVTLAPKGKKTPAQQLAKLQAFVNAAKSVHYVAESTTQTKGGHGDLGSSFSNKSKQEGDIAFPNQ